MAIDGSGSADQVTYWVDVDTVTGSDHLYFDSTNKRLGIKTAGSPGCPLHACAGGSAIASQSVSDVGVFQNNPAAGSDAFVRIIAGTTGKAKLYFGDSQNTGAGWIGYDNDSEELEISATNVGVKTANPSCPLHVVGSGTAISQVSVHDVAVFQKTDADDSAYVRIVSDDDGNAVLYFGDNSNPGAAWITYDNPNDELEVSAGKVGIGVSSPNEKLEVAGKVRANTAFNVNGTDGINAIVAIVDRNGVTHTLTFTGGILTGYTTS